MFGSMVKKIDSEWIGFVKLILVKSESNVKWFMFGYIYVKVSWTINSSVKIMFRLKNYKS
jgi:hypothetical protein